MRRSWLCDDLREERFLRRCKGSKAGRVCVKGKPVAGGWEVKGAVVHEMTSERRARARL